MSSDALAAHSGCSEASARSRLAAGARAGLLERWRPLRGAPSLYSVTRDGLAAAGLKGIDAGRVSPGGARHALACARVLPLLEQLYPERRPAGPPELRRRERVAKRTLASASMFDLRQGAALLHRPDLVLWPGEGCAELPIAVEVELTVKAPARLAAICRAWARCGDVAGVVYVAAADVRRPLRRAIEGARAAGRIVVLDLPVAETAAVEPPIGQAITSAA